MSHTTQEPSTKFYGPNFRFHRAWQSPFRILMQVHNLQPGEFWNPAWEPEVLAPRILTGIEINDIYVFIASNFLWAVHWRFPRIELTVRRLGSGPFAFRMCPVFGVHKWAKNELTVSAGNYSYAGTATMSWFKV